MLLFDVYESDQLASAWPLRSAYLIGPDTHALKAAVTFERGRICCDKREAGTSALVLQHPCGRLGRLTLQTCLLPERDEPYLLNLELARHRLMVLYTRLEEWSMFELDESHPVKVHAAAARELFIEAMCIQRDEPARAAALSQRCLEEGLEGSEELAMAHSELFLNRRRDSRSVPRRVIGVGVDPGQHDSEIRDRVHPDFDFLQLPMPWRKLSPGEHAYDWADCDAWVQWARSKKLPLLGGPLLNFNPIDVPDWLYIWEHDYDTLRELIYEHIERVVKRYKGAVPVWNVASGLHINSHFTFTFEQLMDLTRMAVMLVKKLHPASRVMVEIAEPFGEYFAENQRSIPPMTYVDLMVQSGIQFDALALKLGTGQAVSGFYTRDVMQVSSLIEQFGVFGKPLHLSIAAPSHRVTEVMIADPKREQPVDAESGHWRKTWSGAMQSHWLEAVSQIALSKPYVESLAWQDLLDHQQMVLPMSGLMTEDREPKPSLERIVAFRTGLHPKRDGGSGAENPSGGSGVMPLPHAVSATGSGRGTTIEVAEADVDLRLVEDEDAPRTDDPDDADQQADVLPVDAADAADGLADGAAGGGFVRSHPGRDPDAAEPAR